MTSISIILSQENYNRFKHFTGRLKDLEEKLNGILFFENKPIRKINIKKYLDNYRQEMKALGKEKDGQELINDLIRQVEESDEKTKYNNYIKKKMVINRSIKLDEINSHVAKYEEVKKRFAIQKQLEKMNRDEVIKNSNEKLSISVDYTKKQLNKYKITDENEERERIESAVRNLKKSEFSDIIYKYFKPLKSDKSKRKDNSLPKKKIKVLKSSWEPKIIKKLNSSAPKQEPLLVKTPLRIKPDYLTEFRKNRENKKEFSFSNINSDNMWNNMLKTREDSLLINRIEDVKKKAEILDYKAKLEGKFLKVGGLNNIPERTQKVSELIINSIKAKLAILNKINKL